MEKISKFFKNNKEEKLQIAIILLAILFFYWSFFSFNMMLSGELTLEGYDLYSYLKKSLVEENTFPHWIPNWHGGMPWYAHSEKNVFFYTTFFALLFPSAEAGVNFTQIFHAIVLGLGVFYLLRYFKVDPRFAVLSAFIMLFSRFTIIQNTQYVHRFSVIALMPWLFLFVWKALHEKEYIKYTIFAAIILALQFHSGGLDLFIYLVSLFLAIGTVFLIGKNIKKRLVKGILVALVLALVFFGLVSVRLFPLLEFSDISSKKYDFSFDQMVGNHVTFNSVQDVMVNVFGQKSDEDSAFMEIGLIAFLLLAASIFSFRKKIVLTLIVLAIISLLIMTGSPLLYLLWKFVPGFTKIHHVVRAAFIFVFAASCLAAFGASNISKFISNKIKIGSKLVWILLLLLLVGELWVMPVVNDENNQWRRPHLTLPKDNPTLHVQSNELLQYLSQKDEIFRIHNFGTGDINGVAQAYMIPLDLEILYGSISIWIPEYFQEYLIVARQVPAKFWGMLNTKYVYNNEPLNVTGLSFVQKFEKCEICFEYEPVDNGVSGPYLYENNIYLPRAYVTDNAVLIVGQLDQSKGMMYSLLTQDQFNPADSVIILGKETINEHSINELEKYKAIILTQGSVNENSGAILQQYKNSGGLLFPDIIEGEQNLDVEKLVTLLANFTKPYSEVRELKHTKYKSNFRTIDISGESGFVVLSEKFWLFDSWISYVDGMKVPKLRANGVQTAIYVSDLEELSFRYQSSSFRKGSIISAVTVLLLLVYFFSRKRKNKSKNIYIQSEDNREK